MCSWGTLSVLNQVSPAPLLPLSELTLHTPVPSVVLKSPGQWAGVAEERSSHCPHPSPLCNALPFPPRDLRASSFSGPSLLQPSPSTVCWPSLGTGAFFLALVLGFFSQEEGGEEGGNERFCPREWYGEI
jgi:hypothetical protein